MAIDPERRASIIAAIGAAQLRALICYSPAEVLLLTGYWPVMGASIAAVTSEGDVYAIVPEDEQDLARATSDATLIPYASSTLDKLTKASEALVAPVKQLAQRVNLAEGKIGMGLHDNMETAPYQSGNHFRVFILPLLRYACPGINIVSADKTLDRLKSVKTSVEIARIRHASKLAAHGFSAAKQAIAAGRREDEVAADIESAFARVANDGFERGRGYFYCMSGPNSTKAAAAYARTRRRVIEEGDLVLIHTNTVGDGYWTDITRTYVVGTPSDQHLKMREAIIEARSAAISMVQPGAPANLVDAAARSVLASRGFEQNFTHATGHGVGFAATNPNAHPRVHPQSPDILETGMVFNIEPAIYTENAGGMRHCDVITCTANGAEVLTDF